MSLSEQAAPVALHMQHQEAVMEQPKAFVGAASGLT